MKSQSLKFFPRESKLTTQEQLFMSDFNIFNEKRVANQKLEAFALKYLSYPHLKLSPVSELDPLGGTKLLTSSINSLSV